MNFVEHVGNIRSSRTECVDRKRSKSVMTYSAGPAGLWGSTGAPQARTATNPQVPAGPAESKRNPPPSHPALRHSLMDRRNQAPIHFVKVSLKIRYKDPPGSSLKRNFSEILLQSSRTLTTLTPPSPLGYPRPVPLPQSSPSSSSRRWRVKKVRRNLALLRVLWLSVTFSTKLSNIVSRDPLVYRARFIGLT